MVKGIRDERDLVRQLWRRGFAVVRAPASGGATKMPRPDILAGNSSRGLHFAIEVKTTHKEVLYIPRGSIAQLVEFSQRFGCQPVVALKFKGRHRSWLFLDPRRLSLTPSLNYKVTFGEALRRGVDFKTLIGEGRQTRLAP